MVSFDCILIYAAPCPFPASHALLSAQQCEHEQGALLPSHGWFGRIMKPISGRWQNVTSGVNEKSTVMEVTQQKFTCSAWSHTHIHTHTQRHISTRSVFFLRRYMHSKSHLKGFLRLSSAFSRKFVRSEFTRLCDSRVGLSSHRKIGFC
jgi:hypothetical protein